MGVKTVTNPIETESTLLYSRINNQKQKKALHPKMKRP